MRVILRAVCIKFGNRWRLTKYIGHNCIGHSYIGQNYIGHNYIGHNYTVCIKFGKRCRANSRSRRSNITQCDGCDQAMAESVMHQVLRLSWAVRAILGRMAFYTPRDFAAVHGHDPLD